jgi:hypothetical protein
MAQYKIHWVNAKGENYRDEPAMVEAAALAAEAAESLA